uniref:Sphingosine N-acyltransferase-like protein ALT7 n=1 Tax=Alternaria alternata TaxID=5599 RepID=ALT7_ALTAL|nr:RecName: Full=Sphingosine N-acyltransferase-like protein ALT7; AltName: Full=AAL-toxin biosynthesis cluster protein 7 [Alternaria alternata]BAK64384.1 longevity assurance homolog 3 [Alternaria alternata]BBG74271.1 putative ceramide synthase [Alternaria alternata]
MFRPDLDDIPALGSETSSLDNTVENGNYRVKLWRDKSGIRSPPSTFCTWFKQYQIGLSLGSLLLLILMFTCLPYYDNVSGTYTRGRDDLAFIFSGVVLFTALRAISMIYLLEPLARLCGVHKKLMVRFTEQGWLVIHHSLFWTTGMYINYNSEYWMDLDGVWSGFPERTMTGLTKGYYLLQLAFWLQQIVVVNFEKRRKDYSQMLTHHLITSVLLATSYSYYQTKVGNVILCLVDIVDVLFAFAKLLKYLGFQYACDVAFCVFLASWLVARHGLYLLVCWSIFTILPTVMPYGCYDTISGNRLSEFPADGGNEIMREVLQAFRDPGGPVCFNSRIGWAFLGLLVGLQVLMLIWLGMILKVAYKVFQGEGADDTRSDSEESGYGTSDHEGDCYGAQAGNPKVIRQFVASREKVHIEQAENQGLHLRQQKRSAR